MQIKIFFDPLYHDFSDNRIVPTLAELYEVENVLFDGQFFLLKRKAPRELVNRFVVAILERNVAHLYGFLPSDEAIALESGLIWFISHPTMTIDGPAGVAIRLAILVRPRKAMSLKSFDSW